MVWFWFLTLYIDLISLLTSNECIFTLNIILYAINVPKEMNTSEGLRKEWKNHIISWTNVNVYIVIFSLNLHKSNMALHNELKLVSNLFGSDLKLYIFPLWWMNYSWSYFMKVKEFISNILVSQISGDLLDPSLKIKQTMISSKLMWASHCILALTKYGY